MLNYNKSFIEEQFPISEISKESYKERMSASGQTLTGLGKWWGRKPLVLVRAIIFGVLLPVSQDPEKDREIFLKLMTMDEEGLYLRKNKNLTQKQLYKLCDDELVKKYMTTNAKGNPVYIKGISKEDKEKLQKNAFSKLNYDEKLRFCSRPEHVKNLPKSTWQDINSHLKTNAYSFQEIVNELGMKRYGESLKIGDVFSGGGSVPFEAARLGADVYGADLNPIASLLTWSSLNIAGASDEEIEELREFQEEVYREVDKIITKLDIEHNEKGHRADSYIYCTETICPECGWKVPLSPSWVIGKDTNTIAKLKNNNIDGFDIEILSGVSKEELQASNEYVTVKRGNLYCPNCKKKTPIPVIRGDKAGKDGNTIYGLRLWEKTEFIPRKEDVFQERLYCIRYVSDEGRYYTTPTKEDLDRETKVINILSKEFKTWQRMGYIPSLKIEKGYNTDQIIRERGWTYWHHLFNPRQLLINGLFLKVLKKKAKSQKEKAIGLLGLNKICNYNSRLCVWNAGKKNEKVEFVFLNQALNTLFNYGSRSSLALDASWFFNINNEKIESTNKVMTKDARDTNEVCDIWITDPPYADVVNYHELSEFFLAWNKELLEESFPEWHSDSKRTLAVKGAGEEFNDSMVEIYSNLRENMPDNGTQIIMFAHQDTEVWAELSSIIWEAGLKATSAWIISTETSSGGLKSGNYVSGTVILALKKQLGEETAFTDDLYDDIEYEVKNMIDSMKELSDRTNSHFNDSDFTLASYASALKVMTSYKEVKGVNVQEENPIEELIKTARKIAYDYLTHEEFNKGDKNE